MFASKQRGTVIAKGLKIVGIVTERGWWSSMVKSKADPLHVTDCFSPGSNCRRHSSRTSSRGWVGRGSDPRWPSHFEVASPRRG